MVLSFDLFPHVPTTRLRPALARDSVVGFTLILLEITMCQKFIAREKFVNKNGAIGWRPGGPFDCLGPFAKVQNCPIDGTSLRLTCYATGYADTYFSIPACTRYPGKYIKGYFTDHGEGTIFMPLNTHKHLLPIPYVGTVASVG